MTKKLIFEKVVFCQKIGLGIFLTLGSELARKVSASGKKELTDPYCEPFCETVFDLKIIFMETNRNNTMKNEHKKSS